LKIISTVLSQAQAFVYSTTPTNSTAGAWCLREVMMALLLSSGRYSAEVMMDLVPQRSNDGPFAEQW